MRFGLILFFMMTLACAKAEQGSPLSMVTGIYGLAGLQAGELDRIRDLVNAGKVQEAKTAIDSYLRQPKNTSNAKAWYIKALVYSTLARFPQPFEPNTFENRNAALNAISKMLELDKDMGQNLLIMDEFRPVFELYYSGYRESTERFNAKKYTEALDGFRQTGVYSDFIFTKGWGFSKLDTSLVYYTGLSAMYAKKDDEAVKQFRKLADLMIAGKPEMATIYRYLVKYYYERGDEENTVKYLGIGKSLYPRDEYLPLVELDLARDNGDRVLMYKLFEQLSNADSSSFYLAYEWGNELFADTHISPASKRPANYNENLKKIEQLYNRAARIQPGNADVWLALGKHFYNQALAREDELTGLKNSTDTQRKEELAAEVASLSGKAVLPLENAFVIYTNRSELKPQEKQNYKNTCSLLQQAYTLKKDKSKADFYHKKMEEANRR